METLNIKNKYKLLIFFCISISLGFIGCTSPQSLNLMQNKKPFYPKRAFEDYRFQYNDEIICAIFTSDADSDIAASMSSIVSNAGGGNGATYIIHENGNISIPFFGDIHLVGVTIAEAEDIVEKAMRMVIPDAQVKISLKNNSYYVVSEGGQKGIFPIYKENMTIFQALANSGIPNGRSLNISKIQILRTGLDGKTIQKEYDLRTESIIESEFYYIKPNDVVYYATSNKTFFHIGSFQEIFTSITAPIAFAAMLLSFKVKF